MCAASLSAKIVEQNCGLSHTQKLTSIESYGSNSHIGFVPYHEYYSKRRPAFNGLPAKLIIKFSYVTAEFNY